jgi:anti-sigma regulatory factor (Ser/Thr protein kinase)
MGRNLVVSVATASAPGRRLTRRRFRPRRDTAVDNDNSGRRSASALTTVLSTARALLSGGTALPPQANKREAWLLAEPASGGAARDMVSEAAADAGLDSDRTWDLMLATSEAFANAVQHGVPWPNRCIHLAAETCPQGVRVEVTDCGTFDSQLEPAALDATSGRGIQIIAAIVDRLEVQNGNGRTLVRFEKHAA